MPEHTFDAFTRRASLISLGTAALAAASSPFRMEAKKNKNKSAKKGKKQCQQDLAACNAQGATCASQTAECTTFLTAICGGGPGCQDAIACCSFLARCDVAGFLTCLRNVEEAQ